MMMLCVTRRRGGQEVEVSELFNTHLSNNKKLIIQWIETLTLINREHNNNNNNKEVNNKSLEEEVNCNNKWEW